MKRWRALLALAGLFALGTLAGGLGAHLYYSRALDRPPPGPLAGPFMGQRLERKLELSPEQASELRQILLESRREGEAMRREMEPHVRAMMARIDERIRAILTPEQLKRFEEMQRRHRRRSERFFGGPEGRRGPRHRPRPDPG